MPSVLYPTSSFTDGLQIKYLQAICKGYLQACNSLHSNGVSTKSLQMADKMRKKLCVGWRGNATLLFEPSPLHILFKLPGISERVGFPLHPITVYLRNSIINVNREKLMQI